MAVAIAPWSIVLTPGKAEVVVPQGDLQIKNAALPDELQDSNARTSVKLTYQSLATVDEDDEDEDEEEDEDEPKGAAVTTVLCSLTPGKIEQSTCEIILEQDMEYILEAVGKNTIHLYGNYIDQAPVDQPPFGSELDSDEEEEDEEEDAYNLAEVSSDVAIEVDGDEAALDDDDDDDAARFEEIKDEEEAPKNLKRPHDDAMEVEEPEEKLSKSQKKKLAKKLKAADGKAVPAPEPEKKVEENKAGGEKKEKRKKDKAEKKEISEQEGGEKKGKGEKKAECTLDGGVKVRDVKVGTGKQVKRGDKVGMRYIGKFLDGKVFDKNTKGKPFYFTLGQGDVIKGWDVGIAGMQIGGEREIVVPPSMGYGNRKTGDIPPGSTLKFEVKLLEIK